MSDATNANVSKAESLFQDFVKFAGNVLDRNNATRDWHSIGEKFVGVANAQRESLADPANWTSEDYENLLARSCIELKIARGIENPELPVYIRTYAFVEQVKDVIPNVLDLSYFQIRNKFLPMVQWDRAELAGSIRKEWIPFCHAALRKQLSQLPWTIREFDAEIAREREKIEGAAKPVDLAKKEKAKRDAASKRIKDSIENAIIEKTLDAGTVASLVKTVAKENNLDVSSGLDPVKATVADCKDFARLLYNEGKIAEMVAMRDTLNKMIDSIKSQAAEATKAA